MSEAERVGCGQDVQLERGIRCRMSDSVHLVSDHYYPVQAGPHPTLLMGDLNEWYLWGRPLRWLHSHFREMPSAPRTFPAHRPVFALDRIWVSPAGSLRKLVRHATPLARSASDHLPLIAEIVV